MKTLNESLVAYIETNIPLFHNKRLESLTTLKLKEILRRKNPYLFKAKSIHTAGELIKGLIDAHLSSQEETIFGGFLEGFAIFTASQTYHGRKSSAEGIDLEIEKSGVLYIISIKSDPNWGNSSQIKRMIDNFKRAKRILGTNTSSKKVVAVNGCCYGRQRVTDRGDYLKLCGQQFWEFISDNSSLYTDIIEPLGFNARQWNDEFKKEYGKIVNRFTAEFINDFCNPDGEIIWELILKFNSGSSK